MWPWTGNPWDRSTSALSQMVLSHRLNKDTLCWMPGMAEWKPAEQVPQVLRIVALTPPPLTTAVQP